MKKSPLIKICNKCGKEGPHNWVKSIQKYRPECQPCRNEYNRQWRQRAEVKIRNNDYKKSYHKDYKAKLKKELVEYLGGKCRICGLQDDCMAVYDFHHRDPKEKDVNIARILTRKSAAYKEAKKCDLLCSNCHRRLHAKLKNPDD